MTALDEMNVAVGALQSTYSTSDFTSIEDLPASGVSTYNGYLSARYGNEPGVPTSMLVGHMTIDVDFDRTAEMISGEAHSFLDQDSNRLTGTLMLSGGVFDNTNPGGEDATFRFEADGDLIDAQSRQLGVEMTFNGDFYGSEGDALAGDVFGGVTVDGAMDPESLAGWFISEKETP